LAERAEPVGDEMNQAEVTIAALRASPHHQISSGLRIPELDGARGVAALAVVIAHYFGEVEHGFAVLTFGWVGVNLFFVLSGFLIGSIILERKDSPNFFSVFYVRRAARILPAYFVTLAATLGFIWLYGLESWIDSPLPVASYFTFTQNFAMALGHHYGTIWLLPTWTVAVEEQFYLVVPLIIAFMPTPAILPTIITGIAFCLLTRALLYFMGAEISADVLLFSNGHALLIGVLSAYIHQRFKVPEIILRLVPLASITVLLVEIYVSRKLFFAVWPLFMATLFSCYILLAVQDWPTLRFLRSSFWLAFGAISYCLYLIHQPVNGVMHGLILGTRPDIATTSQFLVTCLDLRRSNIVVRSRSAAIAARPAETIQTPLAPTPSRHTQHRITIKVVGLVPRS
jgi:peptidoglycan/LPS O-acetylase OafA/YrhL